MQDNQVECRRCGFQWAVSNEKRGRKDLLCVSCRMKPASMLQYGKLRCIPHKGALGQKSLITLDVVKNRHGATGYFEAKFDGEFARVREFSNV